ncbi:unnamed protein product [Brassicogethes aeneus]|uniref:Aminopeptidase n=1 Tax=Brassicogethes aeneus TaxID=1431903 RepID=A0A9P0BD02_BRAAE|nr:unnamed protein product [Brassicogethes aeneus]
MAERKPRKLVTFLASCCVFWFILSACFLTALVLIGRHTLYNSDIPILTPKFSRIVPEKLFRLPNGTRPITYDLYLSPNLSTGHFNGYVNVTINVTSPTNSIVFHSQKLTIVTVKLFSENLGNELKINSVEENSNSQTVNATLNGEIQRGVYFLTVNFSGGLAGRIIGFYRSTYRSENGTERQIATTKFEPTYARQAFPCFDEPNLKATYRVKILKPKDSNYIALSNNPQESVEDVENGQIVTFKETVPMSTYLVCFIVSDFQSTDTTFDNNGTPIPFRVFATPQQLSKTTYAGEVGKKVIEYYVSYFGIPYPLPKLDMVAIPDFVSGAMEHWGLVTYRETALLYTEKTHSQANKQRVATVIAHELAHSWFGNLVTMNWWSDLWLNEGFASYIEYKGVDHVHPDWGMLDQFLVDDLHAVLSLDATLGSHPIIVKVETPDQITEVFDTISYNKGASVLRMLENTVTASIFEKGVKNYLNKHKFGNAVTQDLLDELETLVGEKLNVTEFVNTFTIQMGYPILNVTVEGDKYTFKQKRFLKDESMVDKTNTPYNYKWTVPITYVTDQGKSTEYILFKHTDDSVTITKPATAKWIKFNYDQVGYYRVNYPKTEWNNLINVYTSLSVADRTHLLEESFSVAEAGQLSYEIPLSLTQKLTEEVDYVPWNVAASMLKKIKGFLKGEVETNFKKYIQRITNNAYSKLTWTENVDDGHLKRLARVVVLNLACSVDHEECLAAATEKFNEWIQNIETVSLSQDLRGLIYQFGMKTANESTWNKMADVYVKESDANEKLKILKGLASVNKEDLLKNLLTKGEDESFVRSQDYFSLLAYISANPLGESLVWDYVRTNWEKLVQRFTLNDRNFGRMVGTITSDFSTEERLKEMQDFFAKYPNAGAGASARVQALEKVNNNIKWKNAYQKNIEDWITTNAPKKL